MSRLTIRKRRLNKNTEHELSSNGIRKDGLTWDEMLGGVARCFVRDWFIGLPEGRCKQREDWVVEYELCIEGIGGLYLITNEDRFISHLTFDEMLGFIAKYTLTGDQMFGGFQTYSQWAEVPYHKREIAGLLPGPTA